MLKKKCLLSMLLAICLCLCLAMPAIAADTYPVGIQKSTSDGYNVQAVARNGVTYLPLRTLFESCDASVEWDPAQKIITASRMDGAVIKFNLSQNTIETTQQGQTVTSKMQQQCYIQNGTTYLPLRQAAEAMACAVVWDEHAKTVYLKTGLIKLSDSQGQSYIVNIINGSLYYNDGNQLTYLGNCGIAEHLLLAKSAYGMPDNWQLDKTAGGGYILQCQYGFYGSMIHTMNFVSYMNFPREQVYSAASEHDLFWQQTGDKIYLTDNNNCLFSIDETSGSVSKLDLTTMLNGVSGGEAITDIVPVAVDENFIFFKSNLRTNLLMFDTAAKKLVDFQDILLTDEVKAATGIPSDSDGWTVNFAPNVYSLEMGPRFHFVRIENGTLYLELRTYMDIVIIPLEYTYK